MVTLRRVCESNSDHIESLKALLKFYSKDPNSWDKEWSVNPYYMVDLKRYGAGHCVCGHNIRYQYQFLNTRTGKTFPVGSVCVHLLNLSSFDETIDRLERINQMAMQELDTSLDPIDFVKKYRKFFNLKNIEALASYNLYDMINNYSFNLFRDAFNKRNLSEYVASKMKDVIIDIQKKAEKFINGIENQSKPVSQAQVQSIIDDSAEEMLKFAKAKQNKLPF